MIAKGKGIWKRIMLVLLLSVLAGISNQFTRVNGEETDFQKIRLTPTEVTWEIDEEDNNETSVFSVYLNVTIYNPNSYSLDLSYPTELIQMIGTVASIELEENKTANLYCACATFCTVMDYRTINPGYTTNLSASKLTIHKDGLTELPDGNYTLSAYLYNQNTTKYISDKLIIQMDNGVPTIDFSTISSVNTGIQELIFPTTIITIFFWYDLRRRKK